jgi:hypothetical protein
MKPTGRCGNGSARSGVLRQNFTWDLAAWKCNFRFRGEQPARPVKKVWSILIMARVNIKRIEGL